MKEAIDEDLSAAEYELRATQGSELDLAACLNFAARFLRCADEIWASCSTSQKSRLQWVLFPNGIEFLR